MVHLFLVQYVVEIIDIPFKKLMNIYAEIYCRVQKVNILRCFFLFTSLT